jgi:hypothetical protein
MAYGCQIGSRQPQSLSEGLGCFQRFFAAGLGIIKHDAVQVLLRDRPFLTVIGIEMKNLAALTLIVDDEIVSSSDLTAISVTIDGSKFLGPHG